MNKYKIGRYVAYGLMALFYLIVTIVFFVKERYISGILWGVLTLLWLLACYADTSQQFDKE